MTAVQVPMYHVAILLTLIQDVKELYATGVQQRQFVLIYQLQLIIKPTLTGGYLQQVMLIVQTMNYQLFAPTLMVLVVMDLCSAINQIQVMDPLSVFIIQNTVPIPRVLRVDLIEYGAAKEQALRAIKITVYLKVVVHLVAASQRVLFQCDASMIYKFHVIFVFRYYPCF